MMFSIRSFPALFLCLATFACEKNEEQAPPPEPLQVISKKPLRKVMRIDTLVKDAEVEVFVKNVPENSELRCKLDKRVLTTCGDTFSMPLPELGDHILQIDAYTANEKAATGKTIFRIYKKTTEPLPVEDVPTGLDLVSNDANFHNGMAINRTQAFTAKFRFKDKVDCKAKLECAYDSIDSKFWRNCTAVDQELIPAGMMAAGLQYLSIRASCGDRVGEKLTLYWYGVDQGYQPLALQNRSAGPEAVQVFTLQKANDCPENLLRFECSQPNETSFKACPNTVRAPKPGFQMRATCDGKPGPTLRI